MNNIMMIDKHKAKISYDPEIQMFRGEFIGLNGGADFYSDSVAGLESEGRQSLNTFFEVCKEQGIDPYQNYSGKFLTRLPSELHQQIANKAQEQGKSLNQWISEVLSREVSHA